MWVALLPLGLLLGYAVSMWSQKSAISQPTSLAKQTEPAVKPASAKKPEPNVSLAASDAKPIQMPQAIPVVAAEAMPVNATATPTPTPAKLTQNQQDDILTRRLNATISWLSSQAPTTVSIQLMGASSDEQLKNDLKKLSSQLELDNIYVYRTKVNNLPFLSVLYGSFADRIKASQALEKLPVEIKKNRPQLRTIAGVLKETN